VPLRADMPAIKTLVAVASIKALTAGMTVGMDSLIADLQGDREASSGRGVRASHLATWTKFHHRARGVKPDDPVL
jgi:hypothetical protein